MGKTNALATRKKIILAKKAKRKNPQEGLEHELRKRIKKTKRKHRILQAK